MHDQRVCVHKSQQIKLILTNRQHTRDLLQILFEKTRWVARFARFWPAQHKAVLRNETESRRLTKAVVALAPDYGQTRVGKLLEVGPGGRGHFPLAGGHCGTGGTFLEESQRLKLLVWISDLSTDRSLQDMGDATAFSTS